MVCKITEKKADIYFIKPDDDKINNGGWESEYGKLYLSARDPLDNKCNVDNGIKANLYKYIGSIKAIDEHEIFGRLQNAFNSHELNDRSMSVGDIIIFEDCRGLVVEDLGFSELTEKQVNEIKKGNNY